MENKKAKLSKEAQSKLNLIAQKIIEGGKYRGYRIPRFPFTIECIEGDEGEHFSSRKRIGTQRSLERDIKTNLMEYFEYHDGFREEEFLEYDFDIDEYGIVKEMVNDSSWTNDSCELTKEWSFKFKVDPEIVNISFLKDVVENQVANKGTLFGVQLPEFPFFLRWEYWSKPNVHCEHQCFMYDTLLIQNSEDLIRLAKSRFDREIYYGTPHEKIAKELIENDTTKDSHRRYFIVDPKDITYDDGVPESSPSFR